MKFWQRKLPPKIEKQLTRCVGKSGGIGMLFATRMGTLLPFLNKRFLPSTQKTDYQQDLRGFQFFCMWRSFFRSIHRCRCRVGHNFGGQVFFSIRAYWAKDINIVNVCQHVGKFYQFFVWCYKVEIFSVPSRHHGRASMTAMYWWAY